MAKVTFGGGVVNFTGRLGGSVFQNGIAGPIVRTLSIPVNPARMTQTLARASMTTLAYAWSTLLTDAQRKSWEAAAPVKRGKKGEPIDVVSGGRTFFNATNRVILGAGAPMVLTPNFVGSYAPLVNPAITVDSGSQTIIFTFDGPVLDVNSVLQLWTTQPLSAGNSYKNIGEKFTANFSTPVSPIDITAEWTKVHGGWQFEPGCRVYCMPYIVSIITGQITGQIILQAVST